MRYNRFTDEPISFGGFIICSLVVIAAITSLFVFVLQYDSDVRQENIQLTQELNKQEEQTKAWMDEAYRLNGEIDKLTEEKAGLEEELATSQVEVLDLKTQLEALQAQVNELNSQLTIQETNNYSDITMTSEEEDLLARILALEAGDQSDDGQKAVVEVVCNRIHKGVWGGKTIKAILLAKGQFSTVKNLDKPWNTPTEKEYKNIHYVLEHGLTVLPSEDFVYFASYSGANGYDEIKLGDHYFAKG